MNFYTIKQDQSGRPVPFNVTTPLEAATQDAPAKINDDFFYGTHGVRLTDYEIDNYKAHFSIWRHFNQFAEHDICMIVEEGVHLNATVEELESYFSDVDDSWDVFFPYDKISEEGRTSVTEISASKFGFFWGSYCYFMRKSGARKMVGLGTINQPVDEELVKQSFSGQIETIFSKTDWFEYNESESPSYLARNQSVKDAIFTHQAWSEETKKDAVAIMRYLSNLAEEMGMDLFLHAGTLLGGVRHGGIMPWDDDIDLMMRATDIDAFIREVERGGEVEWCSWIWQKTNQKYYKFWFKTGQKAEGFPYLFPFVDIWILFEKENGGIHTCDGYRFDHSTYFPAQPLLFEGCRMRLPNDYRRILDTKYEDWTKRIKVFTWSHRVKASVFKPLSLAIQVDENGRYIKE